MIVILFVLLISITFNFYRNGELPNNQGGRSDAQIKETEWKFAVVCSRSQQSLEFGHFILMFCRAQQRNVPKFKTHVRNCYFCSFNFLCCGVFTAVTDVVAHSALIAMEAVI